MDQDLRVGQRHALALRAAGQQQRAHRHRDADADRLHVGLDELHRVVDRQARVHRAARRVDVERDVLVGVLGLQVQQLGHDQVGDLVVDRRAEEDDPLVEQAGVDVERALPAGGLLDDHRYEWAHGPRFVSLRSARIPARRQRRPACRASLAVAGPRVCQALGRRSAAGRPELRPRPARRLAARASTACSRAFACSTVIGLAASASRSSALRCGEVLAAARRGGRRSRRRSSSFSGVVPSRSAVGASASSSSLLGRLDALGLDDRGEHGLAPQRLLGVGLAPRRAISVLVACRRSAGRPRARCPGARASGASGPTARARAPRPARRAPRPSRSPTAASSAASRNSASIALLVGLGAGARGCPRAARRACRSRRVGGEVVVELGQLLGLDLLDRDRELRPSCRRARSAP